MTPKTDIANKRQPESHKLVIDYDLDKKAKSDIKYPHGKRIYKSPVSW